MAVHHEAAASVFTLIDSVAKEVRASGLNTGSKAAAARDVALAYRYALGGQQPGGVTIQKG